MVCDTARFTEFGQLEKKCYACANKNRIIDAPNANVYMYMELLICCMTLGLGYRTEEDYKGLYVHASGGHSFNPDEVPRTLFDDPEGKF